MTRAIRFATLLLALAASTHARAKGGEHALFAADTPLTVTLQAPWSQVVDDPQDPRRYPAVLAFDDAQGAHRLDATVETRGITRLRMCRFPPIRLRLGKDVAKGTGFAGQESLKLTTHCNPSPAYSQYYLEEALAYRIYNLMTPLSFRVRPLAITYQDTQGGKRDGPRFGFFVEDVGDVARRNDLEQDKKVRFSPGDFDSLAISRFMLFEYLIGNTDWDVTTDADPDGCCHNVRVLGAPGQGRVPVPYDFDSSGMVNASYAAPSEVLPIKDVRERLFRGFCRHNDTLDAARREYLGKREAILALVREDPRLNASRKRAVAEYFGKFYATLDDDARFAREVSGKCRK
jgi:hypothetical protein